MAYAQQQQQEEDEADEKKEQQQHQQQQRVSCPLCQQPLAPLPAAVEEHIRQVIHTRTVVQFIRWRSLHCPMHSSTLMSVHSPVITTLLYFGSRFQRIRLIRVSE